MPKPKSLAAAVASARANFALGVVLPLLLIWSYRPIVCGAIEETRAEPDRAQTPVCAPKAEED